MTDRLKESIRPDVDDVRIIRALQIDPRASFARIAAALALTELSVARRYRRMVRVGIIQVIGVVDTGVLGHSQWIVRMSCRPGSAEAIAEGLARRDDIQWIALGAAAGSDVTFALLARSHDLRDDLLNQRLPRTKSVLDIRTSMLLHQFLGSRGHNWAALRETLAPAEESSLRSTGNPWAEMALTAASPIELAAEDEALLTALAADGRATFVELAIASNSTPGRVARRLHSLVSRGVVHIDVDIASAALGQQARAVLWLKVHPAHVTFAGRSLARMSEMAFAAAVTGSHNVLAVAHCHNLHELFELTSDRIGALPGLIDVEVSPLLYDIKQAGTRVANGLFLPERTH